MTRWTLTAASVLLGLLVAAAVVAHPLSAQSIPACEAEAHLTLNGSTSIPITPIVEVRTFYLNYTYRAPLHAWSHDPIQIDFHLEDGPKWGELVFAESTVFVEIDTPGPTEVNGSAQVDVVISSDAPAFQKGVFEIVAEASSGACVGSTKDSANVVATPGFHEHWKAEVDPPPDANIGELVFAEVEVTNQGNGDIQVHFDAEQAQQGDLILPRLNTIPTNEAVTLEVGYIPKEFGSHTVGFTVNGRSADSPDLELATKDFTFNVQATGKTNDGVEELPFSPAPLLAISLVALLIARKRFG